jgi:hypothetical protein
MADEKLKQYKITFHNDDKDASDVFLGWNGLNRVYKRGMEAPIDERFVAVLKDTLITTEVKNADGKMVKMQIPRFQYTLEPV